MEKFILKVEKISLKKTAFLAIILLGVIFPGFTQEVTDINTSAMPGEEGMTQTEIISYIAMIVGFASLITFAWWTTARAKKRTEEEQHHAIASSPRMHTIHHHPNDPYRKQKERGRKYH